MLRLWMHRFTKKNILSEKPELMNVYHKEMGKSYTVKIAKRLSGIGVAPAWFTIFENVIIASVKMGSGVGL